MRVTAERGATMVEFAIVGSIVIFLILGLLDVARYVLVLNVANHTARQIVDQAKVDAALGRDMRFAKGTAAAKRFNEARERIINRALASSGLPGGARRSVYEMSDPDTDAGKVYANALLLMPGDTATRYRNNKKEPAGSSLIRHPTCVGCPEYNDPTKFSFELLRSRNGIYSEVAVGVPLFITGNREVTVVGQAIGWQEPDPGFHLGVLPETAENTSSCKDVSTEEACKNAGCDPMTETCEKHDSWQTPTCAVCQPQTCGAYWKKYEADTGTTFCQAAGCPDAKDCRFHADVRLDKLASPSDCGDCGGTLKCRDVTTKEQACKALSCAIGYGCMFNPEQETSKSSTVSDCAKCRPLLCSQRTTEEEACGAITCDEKKGKKCYFFANYFGEPCATCTDNLCKRPKGGCPGGLWSYKPLCKCCTFKDCSALDAPGSGVHHIFNTQLCDCVVEPDDSTGDLQK